MVLGMMVNGAIIKLMAKANFGMWTEIFTKESGKTIKPMDMEYISMLMVPNTKDNGKTTYKTVTALKLGKIYLKLLLIIAFVILRLT